MTDEQIVCNQKDGSTLTLTRDWLIKTWESKQLAIEHYPTPQQLDLTSYKEREIAEAIRRGEILEGDLRIRGTSERTLRRWRARIRVAETMGSNEVLALAPMLSARGNRTSRLSDEQLALVEQIIQTDWSHSNAISYKSCHNKLLIACAAAGVPPPSYPTLIKKIKVRETPQDVRARHGKRMAYQQAEFVDVLCADTPIHGSRPFQYVHIDHTQLDLEVISSRTGKNLGRPWLTIVQCAFTRRILAIYISFDSPSVVSVMMALRDMVRRHGRLPEFLIMDNGADLRAHSVKTFLIVMDVSARFRPAGNPRHSSTVERLFGSLHSQYVHNLAGNTKAMKNVRMTTGKHLPENFAEWTLEATYYGIEYWAFEYYDQQEHPSLGMSPREATHRGLAQSGQRHQRYVAFNQDFLVATCPPVDRTGTRVIDRQRGVKVDERYYWHADFLRTPGESVPVRFDPWDASSVYALVKGHWVQAICKNLIGLGQLTSVECAALTAECNAKTKTPKNAPATAQLFREFMQTHTPEGALAIARDRIQENKELSNQLHLSYVNPVGPTMSPWVNEEETVAVPSADTRPSRPNPQSSLKPKISNDDLPDFADL